MPDLQQPYISQHLHYIFKSSTQNSSVVIHLSDVGSITLQTLNKDYMWRLICHKCSSANDIEFTETGFKIQGMSVKLINPEKGKYHVRMNNSQLMLDPIRKKVNLIEIDFHAFKNATGSLETYLYSFNNIANNMFIKIDNYPLKDNKNVTHYETVYYSSSEGHFFYTDLNIRDIQARTGSPTLPQNYFIGCINKSCYWNVNSYLWSKSQRYPSDA